MRVEIDALQVTVDSMRGVISQLTSTIRRLASNNATIPLEEQNQLAEAVRTIDSNFGSGAVCSSESYNLESIMRVPFDDQDYSYLDELFPEEDDAATSSCLPLEKMLPSKSEEQMSDEGRIPLASAALYAFIASQVNTPGSLLSLKRDIVL